MTVRLVAAMTLVWAGAAPAQVDPEYLRTRVSGKELCLSWNIHTFEYKLHRADAGYAARADVAGAIDRAFASWQQVSSGCSDWTFRRASPFLVPDVAVGKGTGNVVGLIVFKEKSCRDIDAGDACHLQDGSSGACRNKYNCFDGDDFTIALTTTSFVASSGIVTDADIEFNAASHLGGGGAYVFTTGDAGVQTDLVNTLTHEIGHVVGFDHAGPPTGTMYASASPGEVQKRVIDVGLKKGFCETYPKGQPSPSCDESSSLKRRIVAQNQGTPGLTGLGCAATGAAWPLAWVVALWCVRRRIT